jgi:UPF0716 family protein affecting phage T7 exclusion
MGVRGVKGVIGGLWVVFQVIISIFVGSIMVDSQWNATYEI